jgi:hypothetical protein
LEDAGRPVNNGDIVDELWDRIQATDLQLYVASLKIDYQRNPRDYKLILQDIAAEAGKASTATVTFARGVSATYTRKGSCPNSGVHTSDGSIYIGSYDRYKWQSDSVRQYHQEILQARNSHGGGNGNERGGHSSRNEKRRLNAIKRNKKKLKKLETKIAAMKSQVTESDKDNTSDDKDKGKESKSGNAGDAFGGKKSKRD